jgi:hypothetical protein
MLPARTALDTILLTKPPRKRACYPHPGESALTIVEFKVSAGRLGGQVSTEYLQFAGAIVLFLGILIGSYWFVYVPNRPDSGGDDQERTQQ